MHSPAPTAAKVSPPPPPPSAISTAQDGHVLATVAKRIVR